MNQKTFNPVDYTFTWTQTEEHFGWYQWDRMQAHKLALAARNEAAKAEQAKGRKVVKFTLRDQSITRGGIGTGHPQIEQVVNVYGFNSFE